MAVFTQAQSSRSAPVLSLGALASATYAVSPGIDLGAMIPLDVTLEVECTPSTATTGNKQLILFAKLSLDNANFGSGPESGTFNHQRARSSPDRHVALQRQLAASQNVQSCWIACHALPQTGGEE